MLRDPREDHLPPKHRSAFSGPFLVVASGLGPKGVNVQVQLPTPPFRSKFRVVHREAVRVFRPQGEEEAVEAVGESAMPSAQLAQEGSPPATDPSSDLEGGSMSEDLEAEEFEVEAVLGHRLTPRGLEYLLKWTGYQETTWEPAELVSAPLCVSRYWRSLREAPNRDLTPTTAE